MSRFKTSVFWVFVVLALGAGIYGYFHLKNNKKPQKEALSVIPDDCLFYLSTHNFFELNKKINSQSLITDKLKLYGEINTLCNILQAFDSLFNADEQLREVIRDNAIHFAGYNEKQGWIAAFNLKQLGHQEETDEELAKILNATKSKADISTFRLHAQTLYFNLNEGVATVSNRQELIIRSLDKKQARLQNNPAFVQFKNTLTENNLLSVYVNHTLYSESRATHALNLSLACKKGYSAGSIEFQPSQLKVNGYMQPDESDIMHMFRDQSPQSTENLSTFLPGNTKFFRAFGFSSYPSLRVEFPLTSLHIKYWMKANERSLYNTEDDFNGNLLNSLVEFEAGLQNQKFISVEVNDTLKAAENLKFMSDSLIRRDSLLIYRLNDSLEKPFQLFVPLSSGSTNYAVLYRHRIFFADRREHLLQLISDLKSGSQLDMNESFNAYSRQFFPDDFNYMVYCSPGQMPEKIPDFFNFSNSSGQNPFRNFKHCSFSVSNSSNFFKFRFHLMNESESQGKEQNTLWTLNLDNTCSMPASGFVNHNTGENEIIVQDDNNVLYLLNAKGTVLWKKALSERIQSPVYTVDIYKKNKYQMLFSTKHYLHLIDRNGNYVENYPVKLPAEASSPLSVFDYDANKDYRLFLACKNKTIYNYSIHGVLQEKFAPVKTDDEVELPVQYVTVGASDYLVALDKEGKIYTFSRKGAGRIGLRNRATANCRAFYTDASASVKSTYLVYVDDKSGLINKISFEDKKEIVRLHSESEHAAVTFALVDDNRSMDLILTKGNLLQAYNFSGNLIVEKTAEFPLHTSGFYSDESHNLFYSLSEDNSRLFVFDQLSGQTKSFKASALPLISNLFNDNKKYMIISNGNQLNCVLLN